MRALSTVLRLGIKELRGLRADPVMVFLILYTFSLAVYMVASGVKFEVRDAAVTVVDEDRSALSRSIAAALLPPLFTEPAPLDAAAAMEALVGGQRVFAVMIPPRFEADLAAGRGASLQIAVDATAMSQAGNGAADIGQIVQAEVAARFGAAPAPVALVARALFNPNLDPVRFGAVMQVINSITILSLILPGAALLREREHGTLEHLLAMPVTVPDILLAKLWANALVIVLAAAASLLLVVRGALGVPLAGSIPLFLAGALVYQLSVSALGMLLATFSANTGQFGLLAIPVMVILNLLSGATTPVESMPPWLQQAVTLSPAAQFVSFAQGVLYRGAGIGTVWPPLLAMLGLGAAFLLLALALFRRSLGRAGQ